MAYPEIPVGTGLAIIRYTTAGGDFHAETTMGYSDDAGTPNAQTSANNIFTAWTTNAFVGVSNEVSCSQVQVIENIAGSLVEAFSTGAPVVGGITGSPLPPQVAVLCKKLSGEVGRSFRGRFYIPGVAASWADTEGDRLTSAHLTTFQTGLTAYLAALATDHLFPVILHKNTAIEPTAIVSFVVEQFFATQRRRMRKASHS